MPPLFPAGSVVCFRCPQHPFHGAQLRLTRSLTGDDASEPLCGIVLYPASSKVLCQNPRIHLPHVGRLLRILVLQYHPTLWVTQKRVRKLQGRFDPTKDAIPVDHVQQALGVPTEWRTIENAESAWASALHESLGVAADPYSLLEELARLYPQHVLERIDSTSNLFAWEHALVLLHLWGEQCNTAETVPLAAVEYILRLVPRFSALALPSPLPMSPKASDVFVDKTYTNFEEDSAAVLLSTIGRPRVRRTRMYSDVHLLDRNLVIDFGTDDDYDDDDDDDDDAYAKAVQPMYQGMPNVFLSLPSDIEVGKIEKPVLRDPENDFVLLYLYRDGTVSPDAPTDTEACGILAVTRNHNIYFSGDRVLLTYYHAYVMLLVRANECDPPLTLAQRMRVLRELVPTVLNNDDACNLRFCGRDVPPPPPQDTDTFPIPQSLEAHGDVFAEAMYAMLCAPQLRAPDESIFDDRRDDDEFGGPWTPVTLNKVPRDVECVPREALGFHTARDRVWPEAVRQVIDPGNEKRFATITRSGQLVFTDDNDFSMAVQLPISKGNVWDATFSADGKLLRICAATKKRIYVWDARIVENPLGGSALVLCTERDQRVCMQRGSMVVNARLSSPHGRFLALNDGRIVEVENVGNHTYLQLPDVYMHSGRRAKRLVVLAASDDDDNAYVWLAHAALPADPTRPTYDVIVYAPKRGEDGHAKVAAQTRVYGGLWSNYFPLAVDRQQQQQRDDDEDPVPVLVTRAIRRFTSPLVLPHLSQATTTTTSARHMQTAGTGSVRFASVPEALLPDVRQSNLVSVSILPTYTRKELWQPLDPSHRMSYSAVQAARYTPNEQLIVGVYSRNFQSFVPLMQHSETREYAYLWDVVLDETQPLEDRRGAIMRVHALYTGHTPEPMCEPSGDGGAPLTFASLCAAVNLCATALDCGIAQDLKYRLYWTFVIASNCDRPTNAATAIASNPVARDLAGVA